jgi:hypothetical protein
VKTPVHGSSLQPLAAHIRLSLATRPQAADSLRGVAEVWLAGVEPAPSLADVLSALHELEAAGVVERVLLPDGGELWRSLR